MMHKYFLNTSPNTKKYKWLNEKLMFIFNKKVEGFSIWPYLFISKQP